MLDDLREEMQKMIEFCMNEKLETFLGKRLSNIEKRLDEYDKAINKQHNYIDCSISSIICETESLKTKFEDWKQELELQFQNQINLLNSQLDSTLESHNSKINEIINPQDQDNKNLSSQSSIIQELKTKTSNILSRLNNDPEIEQDFRKTSSLYKDSVSDPSINQTYQNYTNTYHQFTSLYLVSECNEKNTYLTIYDTENETENVKIIETPQPLNKGTCVTQLPNGELFCFGKCEQISGITLIIDKNFNVRNLPLGPYCYWSSAIYFNNNVYCFGGTNYSENLKMCAKFDLERNRWVKLNPMPKEDYLCNCVTFNSKILVSGHGNTNLFIYSPDINSFSTIPYNFEANSRKIIVNLDKLYLIETYGRIYENENGDEYSWKRIASSVICYNPVQAYFIYNKGEIYIGCLGLSRNYFKFNLEEKQMIKI